MHVVDEGRLVDCFPESNRRRARQRARAAIAASTRRDTGGPEAHDERSILLRWLVGLGPEHEVLIPRGQRTSAEKES